MTPSDPIEELDLTFSDLVQLVRQKYSNERDNIGYARAAKIVDKAILPAVTEARIDELERLLAVPESSKIVKEDEALFAIHGVRGGVGKTDSVRVLTPKEVIEHRIAELQQKKGVV